MAPPDRLHPGVTRPARSCSHHGPTVRRLTPDETAEWIRDLRIERGTDTPVSHVPKWMAYSGHLVGFGMTRRAALDDFKRIPSDAKTPF